ncbi:radical SAM family heme chaperone HemW [Aliarcobacter butzleri]|uniref:radical SAM family heme chaperone HemW n=1 Tax=Aliarcobacter butzleri TaxID=28197 RepID=UPI00126A5B49|nr:radical SAM family heme chaperone HemW [Aliarcobacter butzleri]MCT7551225.1 radical SAM family heme chaperone HemW [Aliarcobacter butzleri]MCT7574308.1 radical SAM family heme chaperone HemW [Aliarcobacter butzleri]MCT7576009.1 radical SAM family heme chaperone HemW [Aliarcobacter butzleri]MCT7585316.1 radical SAM family heme chaperone HemW [Aliarcobacter butzleri]MCT7592369.1 radical SAM family heme chaperone HemW [Aliarcobacter butzleri]
MLLYIHIPFCDSKCFYCAFNSYTDKFSLKNDYMKALKIQLKNNIEKYVKNRNKKIETVFIGGGTPSTIKAFEYKEIFEIINPYLEEKVEITTEANPNSASFEWLETMKSLGVSRVSFGVQSFQNEKLKFLGRSHNSNSAIKAIQNASEIGFKEINCDIIYGVKNDTLNSIKEDLDIAFSLPITHISAYSLTIEEGTKFFKLDKNSVKIDDEDLSYEIFDYFSKNGFTQYEISNFSRNKNSQSKHNYGYWQHKEYLGVGAGAVGYINKRREYPLKNLEEYIKNPLFVEIEEIDEDDVKVEKVLLGFRCLNGVELELFDEKELKKIDELISYEKVYIENNKVFNKNFLLADELALYILD